MMAEVGGMLGKVGIGVLAGFELALGTRVAEIIIIFKNLRFNFKRFGKIAGLELYKKAFITLYLLMLLN